MSRVEQIEGQIKELTSEELQSLRAWFSEYDAQIWDRQFEADVRAGKLDRLADDALREHEAGRSTKLWSIARLPRSGRPTVRFPFQSGDWLTARSIC